ncbi:MAG: hypothetical protein ACOYEM_01785 [Bacillota bacterium]|jgi:hypothetical protein
MGVSSEPSRRPKAPSRRVATVGLMAGICAALQVSAGVAPVVGHVLSAVCTLPMALVSMTGLAPGIACLITSSALVFSAFPAEAPILLCMTGPLGVALGVSMRTKAGVKAQILAGTLTLTAGMVLLSKVVGIDPAGGLTSHLSFLTVAGAYVTFSLFYSALWVMALRRLAPRLLRLLDMSW